MSAMATLSVASVQRVPTPAVVPRFGRRARPRRAAVARAASAADAEQTEEFVVEGDVVTPEILVVGLGPGNPSQVTVEAWDAIVEPGAVVPPGRRIPGRQVWGGNPAAYVRDVREDEMEGIQKQADYYAEVGNKHATEFLPYGSAYLDEGTLEGLPVGVAKE